MKAQQILKSEEFKKCAEFHGHVCPGLSLGYKAAKLAMQKLAQARAEDEEMVAIVETDACSADAVQVLTGCTFGKGNLIYKDYGKMVLTLLSRKTGRGVRVALRQGAFSLDETLLALLRKIISSQADEEDLILFHKLREQRTRDVLETTDDDLFAVTAVQKKLPPVAKIEPSTPCSRCGKPTMQTKLENVNGAKLCRGCIEESRGGDAG